MRETSTWIGFLLTAVFGLLSYRLGRYNSNTERLKLRLELYDRRMKIFQETQEFLQFVFFSGQEVDTPRLAKYVLATQESYFIFGKDMYDYLHEIHVKAMSLSTARAIKDREKNTELSSWISAQMDMSFEVFAKHMSLVE